MSRFSHPTTPDAASQPHPLEKYFVEYNLKFLNLPAFLHDAGRYELSPQQQSTARTWVIEELAPGTVDEEGKRVSVQVETVLDQVKIAAARYTDADHRKIFEKLIEFLADEVLVKATDVTTKQQMMQAAGVSDESSLRRALVAYLKKKYGV